MGNGLNLHPSISADVSERLYSNNDLKHILNTNYETRWDVVKDYLAFNTIRDIKRSYSEIKSIEVYSNNYTLLDNWEIRAVTKEVLDSEWCRKAIEQDEKVVWQYIYKEITISETLYLTRQEFQKKCH